MAGSFVKMGISSNKVPSLSPLTHNPHVACCVPAVGDLLHTRVNAQLNKRSHDITQTLWLHSMGLVASHEHSFPLISGPHHVKG